MTLNSSLPSAEMIGVQHHSQLVILCAAITEQECVTCWTSSMDNPCESIRNTCSQSLGWTCWHQSLWNQYPLIHKDLQGELNQQHGDQRWASVPPRESQCPHSSLPLHRRDTIVHCSPQRVWESMWKLLLRLLRAKSGQRPSRPWNHDEFHPLPTVLHQPVDPEASLRVQSLHPAEWHQSLNEYTFYSLVVKSLTRT